LGKVDTDIWIALKLKSGNRVFVIYFSNTENNKLQFKDVLDIRYSVKMVLLIGFLVYQWIYSKIIEYTW